MADRVDALEEQMVDVKTTLEALAQQMQQQILVLSELSKQIGQKGGTQESNLSMGESSQGESRLSGKKVKLPLCSKVMTLLHGSHELRSTSMCKTPPMT
ncbi:hypothetical protein MTR_8g061160 [Medicago truncatula]|uniref:Uncharacterized protein n=1 Tax=Medicago truncatula TaxID=3880 RepID=G7LDR0_MEDTR|nr:hypothetical protein MTR_8g061160 [Medicago truncatula]